MSMFMDSFHFLRPEWFFGLMPALLLFCLMMIRQGRGSSWENTISKELLPHLMDLTQTKSSRYPLIFILLAWLLAVVGLAGPVWQKTPQPVHEREDALVIIFDLTRSMYATDVKPNRLVRARRKLADLLDKRSEGVTGLVVFAGDAHIVSPLTDDAKTIKALIPAISPAIMPAPGSNLTPALILAKKLFGDGGASSGRILIVTDEIRDMAKAQALARRFHRDYPVSVLAVGTQDGAPIALPMSQRQGRSPQTSYLKDRDGTLVVPKVNPRALREFAANAGGRFALMTLEDADLDYLLADDPLAPQTQFREVDRDFDVWFEQGPWLLLLILPIAAFAFRRGWVWCFALVLLSPLDRTYASVWDDLWYSKDQQASQALKAGDVARAADLFENNQWKGSSQYRTEDYAGAAANFVQAPSSNGFYNLGNALAHQQQYEKAMKAYDQALALAPNNEDASFNKQLLEKLLEESDQQQQQKKQNQQDSDQQEQEKQDQDGQKNEDQEQEPGEQSEQPSEQSQGDDEESEQQDSAEQQENQESETDATDEQMAESEEPAPLNEEEQQALKQWLRRVPDDPGGLLRRKFEMQYNDRIKQRRRRQDDSSNW